MKTQNKLCISDNTLNYHQNDNLFPNKSNFKKHKNINNNSFFIKKQNKYNILKNLKNNGINKKNNKIFNETTLPNVSINLNDSPILDIDDIKNLQQKLNELDKNKIMLLNKKYIKELSILQENINIIINKYNKKE
jgi:hypothetical protein